MSTINCNLYVHFLIFVQREEKGDYAAEAQFVDEHGNVLARKVNQRYFDDLEGHVQIQTL